MWFMGFRTIIRVQCALKMGKAAQSPKLLGNPHEPLFTDSKENIAYFCIYVEVGQRLN